MIKDIIIINNFYGFCSFLLYNHTLNNINSISLLLFWCEIVCYKTQIIVYFFWGTVRMPLFVREIWRHSHYISPNFGCVLLIVLRFFGWSPNLILLSIRYILYPLALILKRYFTHNFRATLRYIHGFLCLEIGLPTFEIVFSIPNAGKPILKPRKSRK